MSEGGLRKSGLGGLLEDFLVTTRFLFTLPSSLRQPLSQECALQMVEERFRSREKAFLALMAAAVYGVQQNPYHLLLREAGCEFGDLKQLLKSEGLEETLLRLFRKGVFLSVDEFKGRVPIRRGGQEFVFDPAELINPGAVVHGLSQSSGSRGSSTAVPIDLRFIRDHAVNTILTLNCHGNLRWQHAHWGRPGGTAVTNLVEFAMGGNPPRRWFTPVPISLPGIHPRYRWGARALRLGSRFAGVRLPPPEYCPLDAPRALLSWIQDTRRQGVTPHVWTFASSAVRACKAALDLGIDVSGTRFTAGGEPTTAARRRLIESTGAVVLPRYGTTETDIVAFACRNPAAPDDQHFLHDRHAVIQPEDSRFPGSALFITSLLKTAPLLLFNVSLGDQAILSRRSCGCPLEKIGWHSHLTDIRSFEKLTSGGTTFFDSDLIRVLEVELPQRFGGMPTDYQLIEEESENGEPRVCLMIHPDLRGIDERQMLDFFCSRMGGDSGGDLLMKEYWRRSDMLRIRFERPLTTTSGKIHHLHFRSKPLAGRSQ